MADIATLIQQALVDAITAECQTAIAEDDPSRVVLVQKGEFQDDPEDYGVIVCVHRNDPDKTDRTAELAWADEMYEQEMGTIGGVSLEHWSRRFTVELIVWPVGYTQSEAEEINGTVTARVRRTITKLRLNGLSDPFGEAMEIGANPIKRMKTDEGGGPDVEYHWKTFFYLRYLTVWRP
jgi:hypothetical protein